MAVFKLGAFVTEIAGSVGGTTFKRFGSTQVMYNKSRGGSKSKLLSNNRLSYLAWLFKQWSVITYLQKNSWINETLNYQFPDKFGVSRNLSGKDFFMKMNGNLTVTNSYNASADGFDGNFDLPNMDGIVFDFENEEAIVTFSGVTIENYYLFQFKVTNQYPTTFAIGREKINLVLLRDDDFTYNLWDAIIEKYPNLETGQFVTMWYQNMSMFGMRGLKNNYVILVE
jgi:hypothetical protein